MDKVLIKKILVLAGYSKDEKIARYVISLASSLKASVEVLNIVDTSCIIDRVDFLSRLNAREFDIELEEKGWRILYWFEEMIKSENIPVVIFQRKGNIVNIFLQEVNRLSPDLVIIGYLEKVSGQIRQIRGEYVDRIIEEIDIPVLIVK